MAGEVDRDHPRACGEHPTQNEITFPQLGSSPRMRGTLGAKWFGRRKAGIIPAHAGNTDASITQEALRGDHPRACGEHYNLMFDMQTLMGSSPRMRGTRRDFPSPPPLLGIIPAHAGNTRLDLNYFRGERDHPRACGEHGFLKLNFLRDQGSSPRMRGTRLMTSCIMLAPGIIPAHAGNTNTETVREDARRDHPRACGEHSVCVVVTSGDTGSSPRMRGTLGPVKADANSLGIIPAHAGNTLWRVLRGVSVGDHPRACGEHWACAWVAFRSWGSSPRMRGTPHSKLGNPVNFGIIPAHAGNTHGHIIGGVNRGDHPRACGEHAGISLHDQGATGSSPRMRGTPRRPHRRFAHDGIIPAHAGNTCGGLRCTMSTRDHPRACGEHFNQLYLSAQKKGSSPRMRGTPYVAHEGACCRGIIPAHAGNTFTNLRLRKGTWDHPRACGEHKSA